MPQKDGIEATCPECRGPLSILREGDLIEIRCLVGHAYSPLALLHAHAEAEEEALWAGVVALRETGALIEALGGEFTPETVERLRRQVEKKRKQAAVVESVIADLEVFEVDHEA